MNTIDAIMARRSVRGYLDKPVEDEKLNTLLKIGNKAPVAGPFHMTVIRGRKKLDELDELVRAAVEASDNAFLKGRFALPGYTATYSAPVLVLFSAPAQGNGKANSGNAATSMAIAAVDMGLGTCYLGSILTAFAANPDLAARYGVPEGYVPMNGLVIGYPGAKEIPGRPRADADNINFVD